MTDLLRIINYPGESVDMGYSIYFSSYPLVGDENNNNNNNNNTYL